MSHQNLVSAIGAHFDNQPMHAAQRHKVDGRWVDISYGEFGNQVREIAAGLCALGVNSCDRVALLSQNRVEWAACDLGILFAGGVTVTVYPNSIQREVAYIIGNSDSRVVFVEDDTQLQKVLQVRSQLPILKKAIVIAGNPKQDDFHMSLDSLRTLGRTRLEQQPDLLAQIRNNIKIDDLLAIIYTSGTTGPPKGVMLTNRNIIFVLDTVLGCLGDISNFEINLSFLPLSHALERIGGHFLPLYVGHTIGYAECLEKVGENFQQTRPDFACAVPRVFEKVYARIQEQIRQAPPMRRKIFKWALGVGKEALVYRQQNKNLPTVLALKHKLADKLVFGKLREVLGGNLKYFVSGGAPLDPRIAEFFFAAGIVVLEGWGATETAAPATLNLPYAFKLGSVGRALPGLEVIAVEDGELFIRGPSVCQGYWKLPEQSAETFDKDGWYHTGDVGRIDDEGFVYITDRKKELIITAAGKNISPQNIENKLKMSPFISNAMAVGDRRNYITALITLDVDAISKKFKVPDADHAALARRDDVELLIQAEVVKVNTDLPRFEQVKKFKIPPVDFTVEQDELSPSLKLKRKHIVSRYQNLIDEMYGPQEEEKGL